MYIPVNIVKKGSGAAAPKDPNVTFIATKDILTWPARDSKEVLMVGNFVLKPNPKMVSVYLTPSKTKAGYESDGDEDAISIKPKFEGEHPGDELEINEFIAAWMGEPCIIISGSCQDPFRKVTGTKCAPVQLKPAGQDDNDARKHMLVFEAFAKTKWLPGHYRGDIPTITPFAVPLVTAVAVNSANGYLYKLPSLAVTASIAFTELTLNHGDIITLIGGGGVDPATLATGVTDKKAILKDGTNWVALENAVINLQVFKNGALTFLVELSRG